MRYQLNPGLAAANRSRCTTAVQGSGATAGFGSPAPFPCRYFRAVAKPKRQATPWTALNPSGSLPAHPASVHTSPCVFAAFVPFSVAARTASGPFCAASDCTRLKAAFNSAWARTAAAPSPRRPPPPPADTAPNAPAQSRAAAAARRCRRVRPPGSGWQNGNRAAG